MNFFPVMYSTPSTSLARFEYPIVSAFSKNVIDYKIMIGRSLDSWCAHSPSSLSFPPLIIIRPALYIVRSHPRPHKYLLTDFLDLHRLMSPTWRISKSAKRDVEVLDSEGDVISRKGCAEGQH